MDYWMGLVDHYRSLFRWAVIPRNDPDFFKPYQFYTMSLTKEKFSYEMRLQFTVKFKKRNFPYTAGPK